MARITTIECPKILLSPLDTSKLTLPTIAAGTLVNSGICFFGGPSLSMAAVNIGPPIPVPPLTMPYSLEVIGIAHFIGATIQDGLYTCNGVAIFNASHTVNGLNTTNASNTPTVSPLESSSNVGWSFKEISFKDNDLLCSELISRLVLSIIVRFESPRKSIFSRPISAIGSKDN